MPTASTLTTAQLMAIYRQTHRPSQWLGDLLARGKILSEKSKIEFDFEDLEFGLAPFVRACDEGVATPSSGFFTKWFRPAYVKMKDAINVCDDQPSWYAGERPYSNLSMREKFNIARARIVQRHGYMLDVRAEWVAAKLAVDGQYNIAFQGSSGNVIQNIVMNYGRDPALTMAPVTTWDVATAQPEQDLQRFIGILTEKSKGRPFLCIMGRDVHMNMVSHESFNDLNMAGSRLRSQNFDLTSPSYRPYNGAYRIGGYGGIDYWTYNGQYRKSDGTMEHYIDPKKLILVAAHEAVPIMTKFFGAIHDHDSLRAVEVFQKEGKEFDPSVTQILTQQAPLHGMLNPHLIATAQVLP